MELKEVIAKLESNSQIIASFIKCIPDEQVKWKDKDKWSVLEIINHLYDEERMDFKIRLELTLEDPLIKWPPINPQAWVEEHKYMEHDVEETLVNFLSEREKSIQWLKSLKDPQWHNTHEHPQAGPMSASRILYNWLAHDYHHIRQLLNLNYTYLRKNVAPINLDYAGNW